MLQVPLFLLLLIFALVVLGLVVAFVLVPLFKMIGWLISSFFRAIGWIIAHVFEFVTGVISDALRLVSSIIVMIALLPFAPLNVLLGRWSAAGHYAESIRRECTSIGLCVYRICLHRPLKLLWLHGILEGVEQRLPEAMAAAPGPDRPRRSPAGQIEGYRIVGSLPGGGSGARLYVAEPEPARRARVRNLPDRVVIKSFAITEDSSLPQIVRESRALESARQLGHVLDHGIDEHRFFYVMPYHPGDHLGVITRQLHAESDGRGLDDRSLRTAMAYIGDLLQTLSTYHAGGLWHKDVKPENVIVHDGRAHLVDLGLVTPLRSAMTLTTHGTEYFRDPEMVRQALRGVKVHQVDGAKFDVYAVGAVLYFMIENTFPAHGGLSSFTKKSPEGLRWIVRRAMADYHHRYTSADEMLADLRVIATASDLEGMRPADLPSMVGNVADAQLELDPPRAAGPDVAAAAVAASAHEPLPRPEPAPHRPEIRVTNWWTGAYTVGTSSSRPAPASDAAAARIAATSLDEVRRLARGSRGRGDRPAAREQLRTARARADQMQRRARTRHRSVAERQPTAALIGATLVFLLVGFVLVGVIADIAGRRPTAGPMMAASTGEGGTPLMVVLEGADFDDPAARLEVKRQMEQWAKDGYEVVLPRSDEYNDRLVELLEEWNDEPDGPADALLEELFAEESLYGVVHVRGEGDRGGTASFSSQLIRSTTPGAMQRRLVAAGGGGDLLAEQAPDAPVLLVNDHPAGADPRVQQAIDELIDRYRGFGWTIVIDDDAEALVRPVLPAGGAGSSAPLPERFAPVLAELRLGGVLHVTRAPGEGAPHERLAVRRIMAGSEAPTAAARADSAPTAPLREPIHPGTPN